jgi:hypothetical protein
MTLGHTTSEPDANLLLGQKLLQQIKDKWRRKEFFPLLSIGVARYNNGMAGNYRQ